MFLLFSIHVPLSKTTTSDVEFGTARMIMDNYNSRCRDAIICEIKLIFHRPDFLLTIMQGMAENEHNSSCKCHDSKTCSTKKWYQLTFPQSFFEVFSFSAGPLAVMPSQVPYVFRDTYSQQAS